MWLKDIAADGGKMTSQIHRLTLHLTGYYKETQQRRHNAWQQKIENKRSQNDDEKWAFFSISMFFFFPHYGARATVPCANKNNDCNQRNTRWITHWHFTSTETYWLTRPRSPCQTRPTLIPPPCLEEKQCCVSRNAWKRHLSPRQ